MISLTERHISDTATSHQIIGWILRHWPVMLQLIFTFFFFQMSCLLVMQQTHSHSLTLSLSFGLFLIKQVWGCAKQNKTIPQVKPEKMLSRRPIEHCLLGFQEENNKCLGNSVACLIKKPKASQLTLHSFAECVQSGWKVWKLSVVTLFFNVFTVSPLLFSHLLTSASDECLGP